MRAALCAPAKRKRKATHHLDVRRLDQKSLRSTEKAKTTAQGQSALRECPKAREPDGLKSVCPRARRELFGSRSGGVGSGSKLTYRRPASRPPGPAHTPSEGGAPCGWSRHFTPRAISLRGYSDATFKYSKDTWLPTLRPYTAPTHADTPTPENTPKTLTCDGATSAVARVAAQCASAATPLRHHPISCCRPCRLRMVGSIYTPGC